MHHHPHLQQLGTEHALRVEEPLTANKQRK